LTARQPPPSHVILRPLTEHEDTVLDSSAAPSHSIFIDFTMRPATTLSTGTFLHDSFDELSPFSSGTSPSAAHPTTAETRERARIETTDENVALFMSGPNSKLEARLPRRDFSGLRRRAAEGSSEIAAGGPGAIFGIASCASTRGSFEGMATRSEVEAFLARPWGRLRRNKDQWTGKLAEGGDLLGLADTLRAHGLALGLTETAQARRDDLENLVRLKRRLDLASQRLQRSR
jgi:hypothetical protein